MNDIKKNDSNFKKLNGDVIQQSISWTDFLNGEKDGSLTVTKPLTDDISVVTIDNLTSGINFSQVVKALNVKNSDAISLGMITQAGIPGIDKLDLSIDQVNATVARKDKTGISAFVASYDVPVKIAKGQKWKFFDILSIGDAAFTFTIMNPYLQNAGPSFFSLSCQLDIPAHKDVVIGFKASYPDYILFGQLVSGTLNVGEAIDCFLSEIDIKATALNSLVINKLNVSAHFKYKVFQVSVGATGPWNLFELDSKSLAVSDLSLSLSYNANNKDFSLNMIGSLGIFGIPLQIQAYYDKSVGGFTYLSGTLEEDEINPQSLTVESILKDVFGGDSPQLPEFLSSVSLSGLSVVAKPADYSYSCSLSLKSMGKLAGEFEIVSASLNLDHNQNGADISANLLFKVGDILFSLSGQESEGNWTLTGDMIAQSTPTIGSLLESILTPDLCDIVPSEVTSKNLKEIQVCYDTKSEKITFSGTTTEGDDLYITSMKDTVSGKRSYVFGV